MLAKGWGCATSPGLTDNIRWYMRQLHDDGADDRNKGFCVHCGAAGETRDHCPSRVFLDEPFPENLPHSPACLGCNSSASKDEEYLACLLECVMVGDVIPSMVHREKIANCLRRSPALVESLRQARNELNGQVRWTYDDHRVRAVIMKLARGHVAYELSEPRIDEPSSIWFKPLCEMSDKECEFFEHGEDGVSHAIWPEVGSRAMQRILVTGIGVAVEDEWLLVQAGRYRYQVSWGGQAKVKIVIREYLACEVTWE